MYGLEGNGTCKKNNGTCKEGNGTCKEGNGICKEDQVDPTFSLLIICNSIFVMNILIHSFEFNITYL